MGFDLKALPDGFTDDPSPAFAALRETAPVCPQPDGSMVISRHADLDRIYRDTTTFVSDKTRVFAPKFGTGTPLYAHHTTSLVFSDPPLHTRVRSVMVGALTPRALAAMEPALVALVDGLLDELTEGCDLIEGFAGAIPIEVIGNLLGIPRDRRGPLRGWSLAILGALEPVLSPAQMAAGNTAVTEFLEFLREIVADRRARPGNPETDVLTRLFPELHQGDLMALLAQYREAYLSKLPPEAPLFAGALEALQRLHADGYRLAVATGKSRAGLRRSLAHHTDVRDLLVSSRTADETASKPDPLMLRELLEELDVPAQRALMVGDTEYDAHMAAAIGMPMAGVVCGVHDDQRLREAGAEVVLEYAAHLPVWLAHGGRTVPG